MGPKLVFAVCTGPVHHSMVELPHTQIVYEHHTKGETSLETGFSYRLSVCTSTLVVDIACISLRTKQCTVEYAAVQWDA